MVGFLLFSLYGCGTPAPPRVLKRLLQLTGIVIKTIDFRDSLSSISLLKVSQVFGRMNVAEILEIRGVDSDIRQDLYKVLPRREYEFLGTENGAAEEPDRVLIRKCC
jgi:hypothetical protein